MKNLSTEKYPGLIEKTVQARERNLMRVVKILQTSDRANTYRISHSALGFCLEKKSQDRGRFSAVADFPTMEGAINFIYSPECP